MRPAAEEPPASGPRCSTLEGPSLDGPACSLAGRAAAAPTHGWETLGNTELRRRARQSAPRRARRQAVWPPKGCRPSHEPAALSPSSAPRKAARAKPLPWHEGKRRHQAAPGSELPKDPTRPAPNHAPGQVSKILLEPGCRCPGRPGCAPSSRAGTAAAAHDVRARARAALRSSLEAGTPARQLGRTLLASWRRRRRVMPRPELPGCRTPRLDGAVRGAGSNALGRVFDGADPAQGSLRVDQAPPSRSILRKKRPRPAVQTGPGLRWTLALC